MMKKLFSVLLVSLLGVSIFAISYKNNMYQKLADEYTRKAQSAMDAGQYDDAVKYSSLAEENAEYSRAYIEMAMSRKTAEDSITLAKNKIAWADKINASVSFPMAYTAAVENLQNAEVAFAKEDFEKATEYAKQVLESLDGVTEKTPLPEYYIVRPWAESKDCFWNIAARPYVYNNPWLWENLYQANKSDLPEPSNPNLIEPGMKMKIPSINGEYRTGTYDPKVKYDTFSKEDK